MTENNLPWGEGTASREELVKWLKDNRYSDPVDLSCALVEIFLTVAKSSHNYANPQGDAYVMLDGSFDMGEVAKIHTEAGLVAA